VATFTEIPLQPHPPFTKVRIFLIHRCLFSNLGPEMHGREDGTVPATFQIMYMVCSTIITPKRKPNAKRADRMEAFSKPTETSREGIRHEEPQGRALSLTRSA